jgi:hypothetical protein
MNSGGWDAPVPTCGINQRIECLKQAVHDPNRSVTVLEPSENSSGNHPKLLDPVTYSVYK